MLTKKEIEDQLTEAAKRLKTVNQAANQIRTGNLGDGAEPNRGNAGLDRVNLSGTGQGQGSNNA